MTVRATIAAPLTGVSRMRPARHWALPALYMVMVLALSSIPGGSADDPGGGWFDWVPSFVSNSLHLPLYAGFALVWAWALHRDGAAIRTAALVALLAACAFGVIDESYQSLVPGRSASLRDWLADAVGAAAGAVLFLRFRRRKRGDSPPE